MLRKSIKKVASVILAIALMVTYVPVVAIAADEEPITAESYQALIDEVSAAETALAEAEAALEEAEKNLAVEAEEIKDAKAVYDLAVEEYEKVKSAIAEAEAAYEGAKAEYDAATEELKAEAEAKLALATEDLDAAKLLEGDAETAMELAEQTWGEVCEASGYTAAETEKNEAEAAKLLAEEALAEAKAVLEAMEARLTQVRFFLEKGYDNARNVTKWEEFGTGLAYKEADGTYTIIIMPEDVEADIEAGNIVEVKQSIVNNKLHIDYKKTDTSVTANFYILKEGKEIPENPLDSQPSYNYNLVGSATIDTGFNAILGEGNIPAWIQDFQFDLTGSETAKYVWYCIKEETNDGWHVDGYLLSEDTTTPDGGDTTPDDGDTTPDGGTTTPDGGDTTPDGGTTTPDGGNTTPDGGDTTPDGGNTTPDGGNTTPDDGDDDILYGPQTPDNTDEFDEEDDEPVVTPQDNEPVAEVTPEDVPVVDFEDEITPLAPPTEWATFEDEETPLDDMPQTGSMNLVLPAMVVSCAALVVATATRKKDEETAE